MINNKLVLALLAATFVSAQQIERDDIPQDCRSICEPVLQVSRQCDRDNENDQQERDCICNTANMAAFATCSECTLRYPQYFIDTGDDEDLDGDDDNDNEVNVWLGRCAFGNSTTAIGTMTAAPTASISMSTGVFTTTVCDDDAFEDQDDDDVCVTRVVTGVIPVAAPTAGPTTDASGNTITPTGTTQTTLSTGAMQTGQATGPSTFDGGAMATAAPMLAAGAGIVFVALAAVV